MKKKIALILYVGMFLLNGCGNTNTVNLNNKDIGFTLLQEKYDGVVDLVYDKATKIIYIRNLGSNGYIYTPYYVMNENNEPIIGVYNGDIEWEDCE